MTTRERKIAQIEARQARTQKQIDAFKHVLDRANHLMEQSFIRLDEIRKNSFKK
jgi:hypothetical protein